MFQFAQVSHSRIHDTFYQVSALSLKHLASRILIVLTLCAPTSSWAAERMKCLSGDAPAPALPAKLEVGVETIHRDPEKVITIYVPVAPTGTPSRVLDTNSKKPAELMPHVFAISDGTVRTPFIGVDRSTGSRLSRCIDEIAVQMPRGTPQASYAYLRDHLQKDFLREPPKGHHFAWDRAQGTTDPAELTELFHAAKDLPVGQYPLRSRQTHAVIPLEEFLRAGYGTCLHKALLAALILEKLKLPYRLVNGAMRSGGHTWIELPGAIILDPSLKKLEPAVKLSSIPGWIRYGNQRVFENQVWPYLALP
jgi:hypothetical protein